MTTSVCPAAVCEPMYVCKRVDGRLAAFRLEWYLDQVKAVTREQGLTPPTGSAVERGVRRLLRAWTWTHPVGAGATGLRVRYVGGSRITVVASAVGGGQLDDQFRPRILDLGAGSRRGAVDPARWNGQCTVVDDGGELSMPPGVHLFLRYRDRVVTLPEEEREPTVMSTVLRTLAADAGLDVVRDKVTVDRLRADCDSGAITEALVTTVPPVILTVGAVRFGAGRWTVGSGQPGPTAIRACRQLAAICTGRSCDRHGWMRVMPRMPSDEKVIMRTNLDDTECRVRRGRGGSDCGLEERQ